MSTADIQAWGSLLLGVGVLLNAILSALAWINSRTIRRDMSELAVNTNSIKDALVLTTGRAADSAGYERGRLAGEAKAAAIAEGKLSGQRES